MMLYNGQRRIWPLKEFSHLAKKHSCRVILQSIWLGSSNLVEDTRTDDVETRTPLKSWKARIKDEEVEHEVVEWQELIMATKGIEQRQNTFYKRFKTQGALNKGFKSEYVSKLLQEFHIACQTSANNAKAGPLPQYGSFISRIFPYHGKHFHTMELVKTMEIEFSNLFFFYHFVIIFTIFPKLYFHTMEEV